MTDQIKGSPLKDFWGRRLSYVRISVTDRCNYRCRYCMPESGVDWIAHDKILTYEEIFFLTEILRGLGTEKIRFTGGEPLVRKGMVPFLEKITAAFPDLRIALTTNGSILLQHARALAGMGLSSINISLDTMSQEKFSHMTRGALLAPVLDGIETLASLTTGTEVKINAVLMQGMNDDAEMIVQLADFALKNGITLRFIEFMPLHSNLWSEDTFVPFSEVMAALPGFVPCEASEGPAGPARYYRNPATGQRIGVISAVSRHFCGSCNRLRVTSTGFVRPCLFSGAQVSITEALRARDENRLRELLTEAAAMKPAGWDTASQMRRETKMNTIGG